MTALETQLTAVVVTALITIIPTAAVAIKAYLQAKTNQLELTDRPTHDEVSTQIDKAIQEATATTTTTKES